MPIDNNCFFVAADVVHAGIAQGSVAANGGVNKLIDLGNHCINYFQLESGQWAGADYTVQVNMKNNDNVEMLIFVEDSIDGLIQALKHFYGGNWRQLRPIESDIYYRLAHVSNQEERREILREVEREGVLD